MEHHVYFVDVAHVGSRLDAFLSAHLRAHSRTRIQGFIASGHVTVDGTAAKPALRLRRGQRVEVTVPPVPPTTLRPEEIPLRVVFEDEHLLVIDKPSGFTVHPGAGQASGTLVNALLARIPRLAGVGSAQRPGIVHRLDKDTSGLLVVAKTSAAYRALQSQVAGHTMERTYVALVHGSVAQDTGTVNAPIGRHPRHRTRMAIVRQGRPAVTQYRVVERFARYTLVEVHLRTGRTHQIRVHFAHLGHPVAGDPVYAGRSDELGVGRQALHAYRLRFVHPASGRQLSFEVPPPSDFTMAVERARAQESSRKGKRVSASAPDPGSTDASSKIPKEAQ